MIEVDGFKLFARKGLFQGRELQDRAQDGCHGAVVGESLVVKNEVLEGPLFDGLDHEPVGAVDGRDDLDRPALEADRFFRAAARADTAAQTDVPVDDGPFFI